MNTFNLTLDLNKSRASSAVRLRQGDKSGTTIMALILDHGATANLTGMTAQLVMELPDGTQYYRKSASVSGNVVTVVVDESTAASVPGRTANAYYQLLQGTTVKASTGSFVVEILPDALEGHTVPESYDSAIQDAIDNLSEAVEQLPSTVEDVLADHPEWTTTVQDGSITASKLATDLAQERERLLYRLANMLTATLPDGETATATDAAKTPVAGLTLYGRSTQAGTPTPSAPVPIESVAGANLVDIAAQHVTSQVTLGSVTLPAGTYTVVADVTNGGTVTAYVSVYDGNNVLIARTTTNVGASGVGSATFTLASESLVAVRANGAAAGYSFDVNAIAIYAGSTAYPYVPYGHAGLWARGRNLLHGISASTSTNGVNRAFDASTGLLTMSGTATANNTDLSVALASPISVPEDTALTLSFENAASVPVSVYFNIFAHTTDGTYPEYHNTMAGKVTFTSLGGKTVDAFLFRVGPSTGALNFSTRVMVEYGSEATAYQPYEQTVTPIDLDGHELRSLPDGTRDEVTVGADGHAVLVQRVGVATFDGSEAWSLSGGGRVRVNISSLAGLVRRPANNQEVFAAYSDHFVGVTDNESYGGTIGVSVQTSGVVGFTRTGQETTIANWKSWLMENPVTLLYPLATPVTIDLGYVDAVPLVGPDLTAQTVPSAPMQLTYERDLNTTLARLESAIATLA